MEEIRRFARTTSMKGVPRVERADPGLLRLMWTLAVLGFLTVSLYQTTVLVTDYLAYDSVTQVSEVVWNPFSTAYENSLPDVNLCNLNPLSSNSSRAPDWVPSLSEYYTLVLEGTNCTGCKEERLEEVKALRQNLLTLEGYYSYIGRENASRLGHTIDDMILSCHLYIVDGVNKRKVPCNRDDVHFSYFQTSLYFNCIQMRIGRKLWGTGVVGMSLVLFLDNLQEDSGEVYNQQAESGLSTGAVLGIQGRESLPSLTMNTMELPPGYKADIRLTPEQRSRLPPPHGKCTPGARDNLRGLGNVPLDFKYSYPSCLLTCLEGHVLEECGCVSGRNADLNQHQNLGAVDYCGSVRRGWEHALNTTNCSHRARDSSINACLRHCPYPCIDYYYTLGFSQAQWPIRSRMIGFYNHFIKDKPFARHFSIFEDITKDAEQGQLKDTDPRHAVAAELIRQNFLEVSISIKDYRFITLNENVKTSVEALISQLGGTLNLWSGISAIILIEILEFIYRLWAFVCGRRGEEVEKDTPVEFTNTSGDKPLNVVI